MVMSTVCFSGVPVDCGFRRAPCTSFFVSSPTLRSRGSTANGLNKVGNSPYGRPLQQVYLALSKRVELLGATVLCSLVRTFLETVVRCYCRVRLQHCSAKNGMNASFVPVFFSVLSEYSYVLVLFLFFFISFSFLLLILIFFLAHQVTFIHVSTVPF